MVRVRTRSGFAVAGVVVLASLVGCQNASVFGYKLGTKALYDDNVRSVYVPVFTNRTFQTTPYRGMEVDITQAVVREIESKTPFKVISDPDRADTELLGVIVGLDKAILNKNQQNLIREGELVVTVDVLWRDLRDGRILSSPKRQTGPDGGAPFVAPPPPLPFDPNVPQPPPFTDAQAPTPVRIVTTGRFIPELGETNASGQKRAVDRLATQIVSMMEKPW